MNSNYSWQKQQANEHLQARRREAELHRLAQQREKESSSLLKSGTLAFLVIVAIAAAGFFLAA